MFDNPKKDLQRLQEELLAAQEPEWDVPETDEDPEAAFREMKAMLARQDWEETERQPLSDSYRELDEAEEFWEEEALEEAEEESEEPVKKKGMGGLAVAIVLEVLAVATAAVWWLLCR